jgi:hypothetical protein
MPLTRIFHPQKSLPTLYATRMLHYAQFMSGFHYDIVYRKTEDHKNVDFLSRFPLPCKNDESTTENDDVSCFLNHQIETMPITPKEIERETS